MKFLLIALSTLTIGTTTGNILDITSQKNSIVSSSIRTDKTQQDTIYIDKDGKQQTTNLENLWNLETTEIIQIGFYQNANGEIQVVRMPKMIRKVPNQLPEEITSLSQMFENTWCFNQDISGWDTSKVTNMSYMFSDAFKFNQDISKWNVSNVTNMSYMFDNAWYFNQDLSKWKVDKVTNWESFSVGSAIPDYKLPKFHNSLLIIQITFNFGEK
ncbi:BspA family leucine-rich repeat surface protein [Spiroplasma endosymbiont of Nebria brevicollis]|uniref:BspA family leucine-rich repeat surface protein n=1 Tax=Spiroplasma endosymbiont of Nebria brevicollis TaxID=3066284 RepID=UPI00313C2F9A